VAQNFQLIIFKDLFLSTKAVCIYNHNF